MATQPKITKVTNGRKRRKFSASNITTTSNKVCSSRSCISPRRLWRSSAPRSQLPWQISTKVTANTVDATELQKIYSLLSQIHRRNKNQHRGQGWWKFLQILRKEVGGLLKIQDELGGKMGGGGSAEDVRRRLEREGDLAAQKMKSVCVVRDVLIARCYLAFSTVVQDSQFASLGVVLMGVLASIGKEVGLPRVEVEKITGVSLRQTGVDRGEVVRREYSSPKPGAETGEDVGEVVNRDAMAVEMEERLIFNHEPESKMATNAPRNEEDVTDVTRVDTNASESTSTAKRESNTNKKGRKKKSAIDDLFAGLV